MPELEWMIEHAIGRKWRRLGVNFPISVEETALRAYLQPLAEKHNAARAIRSDGIVAIEMRRARDDIAGLQRGAYSAKTTKGLG